MCHRPASTSNISDSSKTTNEPVVLTSGGVTIESSCSGRQKRVSWVTQAHQGRMEKGEKGGQQNTVDLNEFCIHVRQSMKNVVPSHMP
ncbi:uncharacterized protein UV8b_06852 [Ustilaginoidea virens]|uniref:Uncharacterized protein n=1 Tax=Ustilaginoidea virens TaxID=1159556 RepID=A0A8E5MK85_USTVR|nr:uncharacterized protein UV8b_06852 [Ustilaginoidea virens]QUC22611.1 hypothetical protein UV8b_06852 [Ustilaginoidea virens]